MKLTPLDIHHKEFGHSLRGYNEEQVDQFLDEVADEFERLFKENIDYNEKLDAANERVRGYQAMEATLNNTMVAAQQSAEAIVARAGAEAATMLRDAELKSKELVHSALQKRQAVANELVRIKQAEEDFRARFRALLEAQMSAVSEVTLPDDVNILLGETGDGVSAVDVRPAEVPVEAVFAAPEPEQSIVDPQATMLLETVVGFDDVAEPPASGFVQSVTLGEVGEPEIPSGPVELVDPEEFALPGFDVFGERDSDLDIEEID
ncbi:MAG: DivIVA domain-containing protein [Coriobacteriia bacterium]